VNVIEQARQAYAPANNHLRTDRSTELQVFSLTTSRLRMAATATPFDFSALAAALHENRRLWTLLAADVADDDNGLTPDLRAQIFYLAEFTAYHSRKVLKGEATVDALVDINLAIMRGLSGHSGLCGLASEATESGVL
jgi:flagellar biosynthesis activator protein FlaF